MNLPITTHNLWVIIHLLGVVIGMGGALASDAMFLSSFKNRIISATEMRFIKMGGRMVWTGIAVILFSGLFLFLDDPARLMNSSKFLAKMTIVAIIVANGAFLHARIMPRLKKGDFMAKRYELFTSGGISFVSWLSALVLGASRGVKLSYLAIIGMYAVISIVAILVANLVGNRMFNRNK